MRQTASLLRAQVAGTAGVGLLVVLIEGVQGIALWNTAPLALALASVGISRGELGSREVRAGGFVFWASQVVSVTILHLAWYLDWGAVATRSSTAGLIFLVAPVYSVTAGLLLAGLTILISLGLNRWKHGGA